MKKLLIFTLLIFAGSVFAINKNPGNGKANKAVIEQQLSDLDKIEKIIAQEGLTYDEVTKKYPELMTNLNISSSNEEGVFSSSSDSPLGIPGFWWGFCLGVVGMIIVYLSMDEGSDRKEQVRYALYGCIAWIAVWLILNFLVLSTSIF